MFYFGCMSLLFTFPVGGVGNQVHKLQLVVSFFFLIPVYLCVSILTALMAIKLSLQKAHIQVNICEQVCHKTSVMM